MSDTFSVGDKVRVKASEIDDMLEQGLTEEEIKHWRDVEATVVSTRNDSEDGVVFCIHFPDFPKLEDGTEHICAYVDHTLPSQIEKVS